MQQTLVVVGGGAAGFFCAINAARMHPSLKVIMLEKSNKLLSKVKISGGGRCNVTHACFDIDELVKKYPRGKNFLKKSFHWFNPANTIEWFAERRVTLKTEADGRMFPNTDHSQTIIECLLKEADKYGVEIVLHADVKQFRKQEQGFVVATSNNVQIAADYLCIACGGFPKTNMFDWLTASGHQIAEPVPSLFTFNIPNNNITQLMGLSVAVAQVKVAGTKLVEKGPLLITHWGLSGPAVLRLSAWGARELANNQYTFNAIVNWVPDYTDNSLRESWQGIREALSAQKISTRNPFGLPNRLWLYLLSEAGINPEHRWAELTSKAQQKLISLLTASDFSVKGKTTFKEEFVTSGGILLGEINPNTMQSRKIPGLFFAGEIMDVDGITGGFNFQHAWTSAWIAAKNITSQ